MLDTALARPPSPTYTAITPATRAPEQNKSTVETDLPSEETVTPSSDVKQGQRSANNDRDQISLHEEFAPSVKRKNVLDVDSESLVYIATNIETGEVVRQIPSETLLRLRAYAETIDTDQTQSRQQTFQKVV